MAATRCTDQWHDSTVQRVLGLAWQTVAVGHSLSAPKPTKPGNKEQTGGGGGVGPPEMGKVYSGNICPVFRQNWRDADDDQIGVTVTSPIPHPGCRCGGGLALGSVTLGLPPGCIHSCFKVQQAGSLTLVGFSVLSTAGQRRHPSTQSWQRPGSLLLERPGEGPGSAGTLGRVWS